MRRLTTHSLLALPLALAGVIACATGPDDRALQLLVRTDKTVYSLATDNGAAVTLLNQGTMTIYAPMNEYVYVQRFRNGEWRETTIWFTVDGATPSFPIPPGDSLTALPMEFDYVGRRPGIYRFLFEVALDPRGRRLVPEQDRASHPFELRP